MCFIKLLSVCAIGMSFRRAGVWVDYSSMFSWINNNNLPIIVVLWYYVTQFESGKQWWRTARIMWLVDYDIPYTNARLSTMCGVLSVIGTCATARARSNHAWAAIAKRARALACSLSPPHPVVKTFGRHDNGQRQRLYKSYPSPTSWQILIAIPKPII